MTKRATAFLNALPSFTEIFELAFAAYQFHRQGSAAVVIFFFFSLFSKI